MRQGTKKILAGFMAMSMVLSCGADLLRVSADEGEPEASKYTVTLKDADTGTLAFAGSEEKQMTFAGGENVTIVSTPLEGYEDNGILAENADTGEVIDLQASKDEDGYVFHMPEANVTVTGDYAAKETAKETAKEDDKSTEADNAKEFKEGDLPSDILAEGFGDDAPDIKDADEKNAVSATAKKAAAARASGTCNVAIGEEINYFGWFTRRFSITTGTGSHLGYCAEPADFPQAGAHSYVELNNDTIKALMITAVDGPYPGSWWHTGVIVENDDIRYGLCHAIIGYLYSGSSEGIPSGSVFDTLMRGCVNEANHWANTHPEIMAKYTAYVTQSGNYQDIVWIEEKPQGALKVGKKSSETALTDNNNCYDLTGAQYGVYTDSSCRNLVTTLTVGSNGITNEVKIDAGNYYVKETKAPKGYALDRNVYPATVTAGGSVTLDVSDKPINDPFTLTLEKIDDGKGTSDPQGNASLAGAEFTVSYYDGYYTKENLPEEATRTWVFATKELENPSTGEIKYYLRYGEEYKVSGPDLYMLGTEPTLPLGTITIEETKAPEGYTLDNKTMTSINGEPVTDGVYLAQIKQVGDLGKLEVGNEFTQNESVIRGGIMVQKRDNDTGKDTPQAGLSFEGTELQIYNRSEDSVIVEGKEYASGEVVKTLTLDENGYAETAADLLPYGDYEIVETVPPTGYLSEGVISRTFTIEEDGQMIDLTLEDTAIRNDLIRGDFEITKINSNTQEAMAGVQFKITHVATGESHIITTDENGFYSSASEFNKHTQDTNGGKATSGLWFGEEPVLNDRGAMPYGVYTIEELEGEANEGMVMYKSTFTISRDSFTVDLGNIENRPITLATTAKDQDTNNHYSSARNEVTIIDEIFYTGVEPDHEYTVVGTLMDKATGLPVKDADGNEVTAERTFTPVAQTGTIEMEFVFNASNMAGLDLVVFEEMYDVEGTLVGQHTDLNDEDQTIYVPQIKTTAIDTATDEHVGKAQETTTIFDTVAFDNVHPGYEYTLEGVIYDRETGEPLLDKDGNKITAQTVFTPKENHGNAIVQFTLDTSDLAGKTIVVYQQLTRRGETYAWHEDILSESQAIHFPVIGTQALDSESGIQNSLADDSITILDTVKYENVVPGLSYTMKGTLYDKETQEPLVVNGKEVTAETTFVPDSADGEVVVSFSFDGSDLAGKKLVCYEKLFYNDVELTSHEKIDSYEQTIFIPEIGTKSNDAENGTQTSMADEDITVTDTVSYKNLIPGTTYTVKGQLYDQETGEPMLDDNGNEITASKEFTPEEASGTVEITFNFSGVKLAGKVGVAFEEVYYEDHLVGVHASLEDKEQMSFYPEIGTSASGDADNVSLADEEVTITDTVSYTGLQPGEEYVLSGTLYNQETEEPLTDKDGKAITAETTFTPESTSGKVDVVFTFDATDLAGTEGVVYERLTVDGHLVASHEDPEDEEQMFYIPEIKTSAVDAETGIKNSLADEKVTIHDTVTYKGMAPGKSYTLKGALYDPDTKEPFLMKGEKVTAETVFTAEASNGTATVSFEFDATGLEGKTFVVYEQAYYEDVLIAEHCDPEDKEQTIYIPEIGTKSNDAENGSQTSMADEDITVTDVVSYKNLIPGTTYTVKGQLYDQETGEPMLDDNGKEITASKEFTPEKATGTVEMTFTFSGVKLAGRVGVAFEEVYYEEHLVGVHASLEDEEQMSFYPEIGTSAAGDADNLILADGIATITDTVSYSGLQPGEEYVLTGTLYNQETEKPLTDKDGNAITAETTFTPEKTSGNVDVVFNFDASDLAGTDGVVYERLTVYGDLVGMHEDPDDENQMFYIPEIKTSAVDAETGIQNSYADDKVTIHDTVTYKGMAPGKSYTLKGTLYDPETKEPFLVEGEEVTAETVFTAEASEGEATVTFEFDATGLEGRTFVVYEQAYYNDVLIAVHCDPEDKDQTIYIPSIETEATDVENGSHTSNADEEVTVKDTVEYTNLIPGKTYTMDGTLYDKETGEPLVDEEGNKVTSSVTFTPEEASGTVELIFTFDGSLLAGKELVAFEECSYEGKTVGTHTDLTDTTQTIWIPELQTLALDTGNGIHFVYAGKDASITDTVTYKGLQPGEEYVLISTLYDKETGEPLLVSKSPDEETPGEGEEGSDDTETGEVEEPATVAAENEETGSGDEVDNEEDVNTPEEEVPSGDPVIVETTFTPEKSEGSVDTIIPFDASGLAGKTVVVYQQLMVDGYLVGAHEDLYSEAQTILIPKIGTTATDLDTKDHITNGDEDVTITDEVSYENLIPGETYTLKGVLMDKETGEPVMARVYKEVEADKDEESAEEPTEDPGNETPPIDEPETEDPAGDSNETTEEEPEVILFEEKEQVTSVVTFTPEEASGTVEVTFHFDGSELKGHNLVVFEEAYYGEAMIADHADLESSEQTVSVPEIGTVATDKTDGDHFVLVPGEQTIVDTVSYKNLIPGKEYTLKGVLMDKESGKPLQIDGKDVTAETTFTPETPDGETTIEFTINTEGLANKSAVCFEKVFYGETEIGSHEDLTDEEQSIQFIEEAYQTGVTLFGAAAVMFAFALAELAALLLIKSRRK